MSVCYLKHATIYDSQTVSNKVKECVNSVETKFRHVNTELEINFILYL